ncbi:MAG: hypothetical protein H5T69_05030 [Chloroflexi bacterium]|nr:hypothetical protein [Chloroflexota bacterium]
MSDQKVLERLLAKLTPAWLKETVLALAEREPSAQESGVSLPAILDALCQGVDLGGGAEGWAAQLRLKKAVAEVAAMTPGLRFIEGDA